jgi:hypothetical protein
MKTSFVAYAFKELQKNAPNGLQPKYGCLKFSSYKTKFWIAKLKIVQQTSLENFEPLP